MRTALMAAGVALLAASPAFAKEWIIDYGHSRLGFVGMQGKSAFEGSFGKFEAHIDFDPEHPETGKIAATIDTASAATGDAERDSTMPQPDWFDVKHFAEARFTSTSIRKSGSAYIADGMLSIKGIAQPVKLPFTLTQDGDHWRAQGRATLARNAFQVGIGQWANENYVGYAVDVVVDIAAKPAP